MCNISWPHDLMIVIKIDITWSHYWPAAQIWDKNSCIVGSYQYVYTIASYTSDYNQINKVNCRTIAQKKNTDYSHKGRIFC